MTEPTDKILKENGLNVTPNRQNILALFLTHSGEAIKHAFIEKALPELDRVTIYRTLNSFEQQGIIHSIPGPDGATYFALCPDECGKKAHHHNHVHFTCNECGLTQCLTQVNIPKVSLPAGFSARVVEMSVQGICDQCRK